MNTTEPAAAPPALFRSAITLSPAEQTACLDIQKLHQLILLGFRDPALPTGRPTDPPRHILWAAERADPRGRDAGTPQRVLVQSLTPPNWQPLLDTGRLTHTDGPAEQERPDAALGDPVSVWTIANPSRKPRNAGRTSLNSAEECGAWLRRALERGGISVEPHNITVGKKKERLTGKDGTLILHCRLLIARGTVVDPEAYHRIVTTGIGPSKAYGCGLLRTHLDH